MLVTVLGSGSRGNAILVEGDGVRVMIDAGFSGKDLVRRLEAAEVAPESVDGIVVTHEHGDHTLGMGVFARRFGTPLHLTPRTRRACRRLLKGTERVVECESGAPFRLGTLEIRPVLTVHDAVDPVAVTVTDLRTGSRVGVATDLGRPTATVRQALAACHLLVIEANHDDERLWNGPYPWSVKQRIASSHGHLSNRAAAQLARELWHEGMAGVVLAHLSDSCNDPELARDEVGIGLERTAFRGRLEVAAQDEAGEPIDVEALRRRSAPAQLSLF